MSGERTNGAKTDGLEWVRGAEKLIESALAAIDRVPFKLETFEAWREARTEVYRAGKGLADLRRLATLIKINDVNNHASEICKKQSRGVSKGALTNQAKHRAPRGLQRHWSEER